MVSLVMINLNFRHFLKLAPIYWDNILFRGHKISRYDDDRHVRGH